MAAFAEWVGFWLEDNNAEKALSKNSQNSSANEKYVYEHLDNRYIKSTFHKLNKIVS